MPPYDFYSFFNIASSFQGETEKLNHMMGALTPAYRYTPLTRQRSQAYAFKDGRILSSWKEMERRSTLSLERSDVNNLPSIRLPKTTWFSLVDGKNSFISLTPGHVETGESIEITSDHDLIVVSSPEIKDPLIVEADSFPCVVSAVPGVAFHEIDSIKANDHSLREILSNFFLFQELSVPKGFHIKKLVCQDDLMNKKPRLKTLHDVFVFVSVEKGDRRNNGIIFSRDQGLQSAWWDATKPLPENIDKSFVNTAPMILDDIQKQFVDANRYADLIPESSVVISPERASSLISFPHLA